MIYKVIFFFFKKYIIGDYSFYIKQVKNYFEKNYSGVFEELGLPVQIYSQLPIEENIQTDDAISCIRTLPIDNINLTSFEKNY